MKRILSLFLLLALSISLCACGKKAEEPATWQEQYDLGLHYLKEGNYEEAILAFEAAIEIDPKSADAYAALADAYLSTGSYDKAAQVLEKGRAACGESDAFDRVEQSADFLQSGDTGIFITEFYFDKAAYLAGQSTEFLVSVAYRCPEDVDCILMIGANTDEPGSFRMLEEDIPVAGSGGSQFHVAVTPVQWENSYFGIYVNLSEANHGSTWTPLGADTLYITPDAAVRRGNLTVSTGGAAGGGSSGGGDINTVLYEMLHRPGALTYADLPELFVTPFNQLSGLLGREYAQGSEYTSEQTGGYGIQMDGEYQSVDYTLPVQYCGYLGEGHDYINASAPVGDSRLLDIFIQGTSGSAGWRGIQMGDSFAVVLEKLSLDADILGGYSQIHVTLTEDGLRSNISVSEADSGRNISVGFRGDRYTNWVYSISFEFEGGELLTGVRYHNFGLLVELTAGSATEPTPAPTPAGPNTPVPAPTPTPQTDLSRTERTELGDGGYILTEYNRAGQITSQAFYNADGSVSSRFTKEYDSAGNQIRVTNYAYDGSYSVSEYDTNGNLTKQTQHKADGTVEYSYGSEYDSSGRLTRNIWYYADGTIKEVSEFDAGGNEIRRTTYLPDGTVDAVQEF